MVEFFLFFVFLWLLWLWLLWLLWWWLFIMVFIIVGVVGWSMNRAVFLAFTITFINTFRHMMVMIITD